MDVMTRWNSTLELLVQAYQLQELTHKWPKNPKNIAYQPLFTTQVEWTLVDYIIKGSKPFRYLTQWIPKRNMAT
jgi:hypothetical protein